MKKKKKNKIKFGKSLSENIKQAKWIMQQAKKPASKKPASLKDLIIATNQNLNRINSKLEALIMLLQQQNISKETYVDPFWYRKIF